MTDTVRWGVIGSGGIARRRTIPEGIVPAANAKLTAVFDVDTEANTAVAMEHNATAMPSFEELLASDAEAVYVATPAFLHCEQVMACAEAGKHVLCEKPLGMSNGEAEKMITACRNAGVKLGCAFMMRFHAQHQAALQLLQAGRLGKPVYGRAQLSCWFPPMGGVWRQDPAKGGGGSLMDMGGHCIDLLEMFFGEVKTVTCRINNTVHDYASEDSAVAVLGFENGAMATVDTFFCVPDASSKNALELYGSQGSILAKGTLGQGEIGEMTAFLEESGARYDAQQQRDAGEGMVIQPSPVNMYRAEVEAFGNAVLEDSDPPVGAWAGLRSQQILTACYESAKSGAAVSV
jgi:predicted dehydrogenase